MDDRAFLRGVSERLECDERRAESVAFAVLQELRDRLTPAERREQPPSRVRRDEFVGRVRQRAVLPDDAEAERAVRAVFAQLQALLGSATGREGEAWDIYSQLPKDLKTLWLDSSRTL